MLAKLPQLSVNQANLQAVSIGQVGLGPISVGNLVLNNIDFSMSAAQGVLQNMSVTVTLRISVEWHVHVPLPAGIPDIDVGDTYNLGSFGFSLPVGNVVIPGLNNLNFRVPSLTAQNLAVSASPVSLQLANVVAEQVHAADVTLPANGFTIAGLSLTSLTGSGVGIPAATVGHATVQHIHGDPVQIPSFTLGGLQLPTAQNSRHQQFHTTEYPGEPAGSVTGLRCRHPAHRDTHRAFGADAHRPSRDNRCECQCLGGPDRAA